MFEIVKKDSRTKARVGLLLTPHGVIETPAYVIVGTYAEVLTLNSKDLALTKTQVIIANTYHLWRILGDKLNTFEGLHQRMGWQKPIITDSGGFQVFSLGFSREHNVGKIASMFPEDADIRGQDVDKRRQKADIRGRNIGICGHNAILRRLSADFKREENLVRVSDEGVYFKNENGKENFLGPELSIKIQEKLGADIILAFDECTSPFNDYEYTKKALQRTHKWEKICLKTKTKKAQLLFGIIQGGEYEDLRKQSAGFINKLDFDGFAIGGSLGKSRNDMLNVIKWVVPVLQENKPRHLLGIGKIEDIFNGIERGIDMFDCVIPTREARHGAIWTSNGRFDITKTKYAEDSNPLEDLCSCPVCFLWSFKKKDIHQKFKAKNPEAGRLATIHNVYFFNNLMEKLRNSIKEERFKEFKNSFLS